MKRSGTFAALVAVTILAACGGRSQTAQTDAAPQAPQTAAVLQSILRPGEELKRDTVYADRAVYLEFDANGDYYQVFVEKDGEEYSLLTDGEGWELNRGDEVTLTWKMDSMWVAGEGEKGYVAEWAIDLQRTKKGPLTLWKRDYHRPIEWAEWPEGELSDDCSQRWREAAEWFFCHVKEDNKVMWEFLNYHKGHFVVSLAQCDGYAVPDGEEDYAIAPPVQVTVQDPFGEQEGNETVYTFGIRFEGRRFVYLLPDENGDHTPARID